MKILYIANIRLPTEKAHGVQIMEMASAFSRNGVEVELVVPRKKNHLREDPFVYYAMEPTFTITRLFTVDVGRWSKIGFLFQSWVFSIVAFFYAARQRAIIYSRDDSVLFLAALFHYPYVFEVHAPKWHVIMRVVVKHALLLVVISNGLKTFYAAKGIPCEQLLVAPDGVNLSRFVHPLDKRESRRRVGLSEEKKIVLYSGHLYPRKGAQVLAEASKGFADDVLAVFVGGNEEDRKKFAHAYGNSPHICILGHQPHSDIPYYLSAADILVLPNSAKNEDSRLYTSPMKLFEYMASGTPIIASDVPSLREVLSEETAIFTKADDPSVLLQAVVRVLKDENGYARVAKNAQTLVKKHTWEARANIILQEIYTRIGRG